MDRKPSMAKKKCTFWTTKCALKTVWKIYYIEEEVEKNECCVVPLSKENTRTFVSQWNPLGANGRRRPGRRRSGVPHAHAAHPKVWVVLCCVLCAGRVWASPKSDPRDGVREPLLHTSRPLSFTSSTTRANTEGEAARKGGECDDGNVENVGSRPKGW
jgi:hypothetical protein